MRLDAIASAGFGMSRSKMSDAISKKDVRVNWKEVTQSSYNVKQGDLIAVRGKGRLEVGEVSVTKKERYRVNLVRYKWGRTAVRQYCKQKWHYLYNN